MMTSFQEFLRQKVDISALKDRNRSRGEWLGAINRLLDQVRDWLREADPDDLLEIVPYEVERVEKRLGIYDAPARRFAWASTPSMSCLWAATRSGLFPSSC